MLSASRNLVSCFGLRQCLREMNGTLGRHGVSPPTLSGVLKTMFSTSSDISDLEDLVLYGELDEYENVRVDVEDWVGVITMDISGHDINMFTAQAAEEIVSACLSLDRDQGTKVIVLTGEKNKSFAAGWDVNELIQVKDYEDAYNKRLFVTWDALRAVRKPIIAAVDGYCLGTGCELALMADIIIAADTASFGQPEITLGITPGLGATQRLVRAVGKTRAMEMILTGVRISSVEATKVGIVSRVVPGDDLMKETMCLARKIAKNPTITVAKAKELINAAYDVSLSEGLHREKQSFWSCFGTKDQKEGMNAFLEKREPNFQ